MSLKKKKDIIIHIGLPKTGTTFLQTKVFPFLNNVFERNSQLIYEYKQTPFDDLINGKFKTFNQKDFEYFKNEIYKFINESVKESTILISREQYSRYMHWMKHDEINEILFKRLKEIFPNAKFFFVVRKQDEWVDSVYNQQVKQPELNIPDFNKFIAYRAGKFYRNEQYLDIQNTNWCNIIESIENKFGKDSVFTLPYEMFKENPDEFLRKFYEHFNIEPFYPTQKELLNYRQKLLPLPIMKKYNSLKKHLPNKLRIFVDKNDRGLQKFFYERIQKLSKEQTKRIMQMHRENNKKLAEYIGMDLLKYGYY